MLPRTPAGDSSSRTVRPIDAEIDYHAKMRWGSVGWIVALVLMVGLTLWPGDGAFLVSRAASALSQNPCLDPDDPARPADELPAGCPSASPAAIPSPAPAPAPTAEAAHPRSGTVLLQESFDDPAAPLLGLWGRTTGVSQFVYVDGYLSVRRMAEGGTAILLLPYDDRFDDATIAVSAQLVGEVAGRYLVLGCRRQDAETQSGYRMAVAPDAGLFALVRRDAAVEIALVNWQESGAIRRGGEWNRLELTCAGSTIDAIVNGQVLASVQDEMYPRGQAMLGVGVFAGQGAPAEAYFDDLEVTRR